MKVAHDIPRRLIYPGAWLPRFLVLGVLGLLAIGHGRDAHAATVDYLRDVKPLLAKHCIVCHGPLKQQGKLRLDTGAAVRQGGESGPAVVPGKPNEGVLLGAVTGSAGFRMPPEGEGAALGEPQVQLLRRWIEEGASSPENESPAEDPRTFWSYQPVRRLVPPVAGDTSWPRGPTDRFLAEAHAREGLTPRPQADRSVLARRVNMDLLGVPPTRDQLLAFLADDAPDAWERLVDRLLANPLYGQRWGRHWMDVWRYSDWYGSRGINEIRYSQRHIWRWRDWIVDSMNADKGYDRMIVEMLAGDELEPGNPDVARATGFLGRNWYKFDRNVWMFETVEQTSQAFLGLTMRCARCHDHKFDPITQNDYYHFRAFFEPHHVRTDPISGNLATEKDATLGPVLREGVSLVYDKDPNEPTYRFSRGDSRNPDKTEVMAPAVPAVLGNWPLDIQPVQLPVAGIAPTHRPEILSQLQAEARTAVERSAAAIEDQKRLVAEAREAIAKFGEDGKTPAAPSGPALLLNGAVQREDFSTARPEVWKAFGGEWIYENGRVIQKQPGTFPTLVSSIRHPRDFTARLRYKTLDAGTIHSVGIFFDVSELKDCQAIYTAANDKTSTVQAFHRQGGVEAYPALGIVPWPVRIQQEITLDLAARGQLLNVWVNGELAIVYTMPMARQDGAVAIWTHAGSAEFDELLVDPLPNAFVLANAVTEKRASPYAVPTRADFEFLLASAQSQLSTKELELPLAQAEQKSLEARILADLAKINGSEDSGALAKVAAKEQRAAAVAKAEVEQQRAELALVAARNATMADEAARKKNLDEAEKKFETAKKTLAGARGELAKDDGNYTALGPIYPKTSTGRRLALAKWMTDPRHPRTSRVAVNHLWMRHFGEPIVPTVANFGPNGKRPTHPELLDWLASEFVANRWSTKQMHRILVTSQAYQMSSAEGDARQNVAQDPENRWLWRMNSRRAESEAVRDSVLYVSGELDMTFGGPEIEETKGLENRRRSLYFRSTPNEKMVMLEVFDQANPNECYRRLESVVPQQALAMINSSLALNQARRLAGTLMRSSTESTFIRVAFETILSRAPTRTEEAACVRFLRDHVERGVSSSETAAASQPFPAVSGNVLSPSSDPAQRARENLILVLINHNDFVSIR